MAVPSLGLIRAIQKRLLEDIIIVKEPVTPTTRFERIGTVFSRVTGLIKSGAMKKEEIPIWYHVYQAFPPKYEPLYDRPPVPNVKVHNILYPEDKLRAKFYQDYNRDSALSLTTETETHCQKFILRYYLYKALCDPGKSEDDIMNEFFSKELKNMSKS